MMYLLWPFWTVRGVSEQTRLPNVAPISIKSFYKHDEKGVIIKSFFRVIILTRFEPFLGPFSENSLEK